MAGVDDDIASVVQTGQALIEEYQNKIDGINAALNAAVAAAPNLHKVFYVDAISGDDTKLGTQSEPFQTIKKAVDSIPLNGSGVIELSINQTYDIDDDIQYSAKIVSITARTAPATPGDRPVIRFNHHLNGGYNNVWGFAGSNHAGNLSFTSCHLKVNEATYDNALADSTAFAIVRCGGYSSGSDFYLSQSAISLGENGCAALNSNNAFSSFTALLSDFDAASGIIVNTGSSGLVSVSVNSSTKHVAAAWYNNAAHVISNV